MCYDKLMYFSFLWERCCADSENFRIMFAPVVRQAGPHEVELFALFSNCPHDFNSVNTSVKNPGSALIFSILLLSLLTIMRHLKEKIIMNIVNYFVFQYITYVEKF